MLKKLLLYILLIAISPVLKGQTENYTITKTPFSSDKYDEFSPAYYKNGLVFCTDRSGGFSSYSGTGNKSFFNLYFKDTRGEARKNKPVLFCKNIRSKFNDGPVSFNATGDTLYFSRNLKVEGKLNELSSPRNKLGIFSAVLEDGKWAHIREFRFNSEWYNVTTPCLSPDGKRLYFASDMPDGYGGSDLYYSEWKNGYWNNPVNMGAVINTEGNEAYPFVNQAGELFFSSDGHPGMGGKDIFYSQFADTSWLAPAALNPPVNSEYEDFGFISDELMNAGYFSSDRENSIDIYQFTTTFPQLFHKNYQLENNYCYMFTDSGFADTDNTVLEFAWDFGDGKSSSGTKVGHCYPGPGDYKLRLDLVDRATGRLFFRKQEYLLNIKELEQGYIFSPAIALKDEEIEFTGVRSYLPGYNIVDYAWDFGDNTRAHGDPVTHSYFREGEYDVTLFLTLRSPNTGEEKKTNVTRRISVVNNIIEKEYKLAETARQEQQYTHVTDWRNTRLTTLYSAEKEAGPEAVFCIELLTSPEKLQPRDPYFRRLPDKYILKEWYDKSEQTYSYTVEQQMTLMALYPSYREIRNLGFEKAQARLFALKDPAEKELLSILKRYDTSTDAIFDRNERLVTNAYILMDQVMKFMNKYPDVRLEVGVHTDNQGNASRNLSLAQRRAAILADYLVARGIESIRVTTKAYGDNKPVAPNTSEANRKLNRRVEFTIVQ